jgi:hypothetical protein
MTLFRPRLFTMFAVSICVLAAGLIGAQSSVAKTFGCPNPKATAGLKGGYFTELRVTGYSSKSRGCRSGKRLVAAYDRCRRERGGNKGSCNNKTVNGLKCKERRPADLQSDTQINARVTCTKGSKKVRHTYQQNLS